MTANLNWIITHYTGLSILRIRRADTIMQSQLWQYSDPNQALAK